MLIEMKVKLRGKVKLKNKRKMETIVRNEKQMRKLAMFLFHINCWNKGSG